MASSSKGHANDNFDLGMRQYKDKQWSEAARSFDRAISHRIKDPKVYECKAQCHLNEAKREAAAYAVTKTGTTGESTLQIAYATAEKALKLSGKIRWQPFFIMAEILYQQQLYAAAEKHVSCIPSHPSYTRATPNQKVTVQDFATKIARDRRYLKQRNAGRVEGEAIEVALNEEAKVRLKTNYEHVLTADIFLRVVEVAWDTDPRLAVRMSGVCRRWRDILVHQPGVWKRLILGKGPLMIMKVKTYLERSVGQGGTKGLRELRITEGFDLARIADIMPLIQPHAKYIERLDVVSTGADKILRYLRGRLSNIRSIRIHRITSPDHGLFYMGSDLVFGMLPVDCSMLREIDLTAVTFDGRKADDTGYKPSWTEDPAVQFANLVKIRLERCYITDRECGFLSLVKSSPSIREVRISNLIALPYVGSHPESPPESESRVRLEFLEDLRFTSTTPEFFGPSSNFFDHVACPNLLHLDIELPDPTLLFESAGIQECLPKLRSLGLAKCSIPDNFIPTLRTMPNLEFVNLSYASLSAFFLETLAKGAYETPRLLPNLVALSLAGNLELRAPILRDLLNSRLPEDDRIPVPSIDLIPQKRNPFKPQRPSQAPHLTQAGSVPPSSLATQAPPPARLRWLNIDQCENVDFAIYPSLERKLGFLSRSMNGPDEDRYRGRGKFDWKLDLGAECRSKLSGKSGEGDDGGVKNCEMRSSGLGKDQYYIHHVCPRAFITHDSVGWENSSQAERSQEAERAKKGKGDRKRLVEDGGGGNGRSRRGRLNGMQDE